ncbi:outer membrane beta-barrel protein [Sphingomonas sp. BGYR3]|uniref:outer membrane beta-barrel protein n=1 Tax=Sphingomonas sp. BGYR3 TaxID=2975483 RepID=UPI0021A5C502|nr:outer membrane beta-barrel protein [Sphingomonas sp. BGYR3]MDG5489261.1 outer membrane beta-barrel protein [Sphingomonas sp. BGYR3]
MKIRTAVCATALCWSATATAQNVSLPFVANQTRRIDVTLQASAAYDTNAARLTDQRAEELDLQPEDFRFSPSASVDIYVPVGGIGVASLSGGAAYDIYSRNSGLDGERISLDGGLASRLSICDTTLGAGISRRRSNPGDLGLTADQTDDRVSFRNFETTKTASLTLACGPQVGFRPVAQISYTDGKNTNDLRRGANYNTVLYGGGLLYAQPSIGEIALLVGQAETDFTERQDNPLTFLGIDGFKVRSFGVSFTRAVTPTFQGQIQLNYTDVIAGGIKAFDGITGRANVRVSPGGPFAVSFTGVRQAVPALNFDIDYFIETALRTDLTYALSPRLNLVGSYTYRTRDYVSTFPRALRPLTDDTQHVVGAGLQFQKTQRLFFGLGATYDTRRANDPFYDYDSARIEFSVRLLR